MKEKPKLVQESILGIFEPLHRKCLQVERREMSSKGLQSLRRKATRGDENRRCTDLLGSKQCKSGSGKPWFKKVLVGVNKLNSLMKTMAQKAGLGPYLKNHNCSKTVI